MVASRTPAYLILAEASLELVPPGLRGHPSVVSNAKRQGRDPERSLLDSSFHHRAMRPLEEAERRGRPDIVHFCALLALGSRISQAGRLRLFIHTRDDVVIAIEPATRLPRVYDRFKGLMEQVLIEGVVPKDERLLVVEDGGLKELFERLAPSRTVLLSSSGKRTALSRLFPQKKKLDGTAVAVGAFPFGEFHKATVALCGEPVSIADGTLEAWSVVGEVLSRMAHVEGLK
jgi:rRNA small subunit pseudouridine methyltransferase Nep1